MATGRVPLPADLYLDSALFRGTPRAGPRHADLNDLATQFFPWQRFAHDAIRSGHLPLWNPHLLLGAPFVADMQSAVLYPVHLLLDLVAPAATAWALGFPLRVVGAGLATALLARALGADRAGSLVAGLAFALGGSMLAWQGWPQADTALWLPVILLAVDALRRRPTWQRSLAAGVAIGMPVLAGHPEVALYSVLAGGAFAVLRAAAPGGRRAYVGWLIVAAALAFGVSAAQLLPTLGWIARIHRQTGGSHLPLRDVLSFVSRDTTADPNSAGLPVSGALAYGGVATLLLAPLGLLHRNRRDAVFLAAAGAVAACLVYGIGPVWWAWRRLPLLGGALGLMAMPVLGVSVAVLAGLGLTAVASAPTRRAVTATFAATTAVVAASLAWLASSHGPPGVHPRWWEGPSSSLVLTACAVALIAAVIRRPARGGALSAGVVALLVLDLVSVGYRHVPLVPARDPYPPPAPFAALRRIDPSVYRIGPVDGAYLDGLELPYGFDGTAGYDYVTRDARRQLRPVATDFIGVGMYLSSSRLSTADWSLVRVLDLRYVFASTLDAGAATLARHPDRFRPALTFGTIRVFRVAGALPRAWVVPPGGQRLASRGDELGTVAAPGFDPARMVAVDRVAAMPAGGGALPVVTDIAAGGDTTTVRLRPGRAAVLVVSTFDDPGWRADVDGRHVPITRADGALQALHLPAGASTVRLRYEPALFTWGAIVSLAAWAVVALALVGRAGSRAIAFASGRARPVL